ncbi:hypothetical protein FOA52_007833 [Chlamydomonas sp. UWO 241]|nr:hypothetical protein FOA52_007833 [Chlamydomonas sp. UWO 241]
MQHMVAGLRAQLAMAKGAGADLSAEVRTLRGNNQLQLDAMEDAGLVQRADGTRARSAGDDLFELRGLHTQLLAEYEELRAQSSERAQQAEFEALEREELVSQLTAELVHARQESLGLRAELDSRAASFASSLDQLRSQLSAARAAAGEAEAAAARVGSDRAALLGKKLERDAQVSALKARADSLSAKADACARDAESARAAAEALDGRLAASRARADKAEKSEKAERAAKERAQQQVRLLQEEVDVLAGVLQGNAGIMAMLNAGAGAGAGGARHAHTATAPSGGGGAETSGGGAAAAGSVRPRARTPQPGVHANGRGVSAGARRRSVPSGGGGVGGSDAGGVDAGGAPASHDARSPRRIPVTPPPLPMNYGVALSPASVPLRTAARTPPAPASDVDDGGSPRGGAGMGHAHRGTPFTADASTATATPPKPYSDRAALLAALAEAGAGSATSGRDSADLLVRAQRQQHQQHQQLSAAAATASAAVAVVPGGVGGAQVQQQRVQQQQRAMQAQPHELAASSRNSSMSSMQPGGVNVSVTSLQTVAGGGGNPHAWMLQQQHQQHAQQPHYSLAVGARSITSVVEGSEPGPYGAGHPRATEPAAIAEVQAAEGVRAMWHSNSPIDESFSMRLASPLKDALAGSAHLYQVSADGPLVEILEQAPHRPSSGATRPSSTTAADASYGAAGTSDPERSNAHLEDGYGHLERARSPSSGHDVAVAEAESVGAAATGDAQRDATPARQHHAKTVSGAGAAPPASSILAGTPAPAHHHLTSGGGGYGHGAMRPASPSVQPLSLKDVLRRPT